MHVSGDGEPEHVSDQDLGGAGRDGVLVHDRGHGDVGDVHGDGVVVDLADKRDADGREVGGRDRDGLFEQSLSHDRGDELGQRDLLGRDDGMRVRIDGAGEHQLRADDLGVPRIRFRNVHSE